MVSTSIATLHLVPALAKENQCVVQLQKGERSKEPVQLERFMRALNAIRSTIKRSTSVENFIDLATAEDLRGSYFSLQELFGDYDQIGYGKKMGKWAEKIHNLQREMGVYGDQIDFIKAAEKIGADPKAIAIKKADLAEQRAVLTEMLLEGGWYKVKRNDESSYDQIEAYLRSREWASEEEDVLAFLKVEIKGIKKIENRDYDFSLLEGKGSIHQYRRHIRSKPAIMTLASNGLFKLDKTGGDYKLNEYTSLKSNPIANAPFTQLPENPYLNYVILIPQHYYLAISQVIDDLGKVKKLGQITEMLIDAYQRAHVRGCDTEEKTIAKVEALLRKSYGADYFDYREAAEQIREQVERTGLLTEYRRLLKDARRELKDKFKAEGLI